MAYEAILEHLQSLANPEIAAHSQRFFKTGMGEYGEGDIFLGIRVPVIRQAVKKFKTTPVSDAERLLKSQYHEVRLFALLLLVLRFSKGSADEREEIYRLYLANTQYVNNWDLVDSSALYIVGAYLEKRERSVLYDLAKSDLLWERRIAVLSTFYFINIKQYDDALRIAEWLLGDREDLIHKAVGWMLREIGKRDRDVEVAFLKAHYKKMPRTMLRYAIEKFTKEERRKYLKGEV